MSSNYRFLQSYLNYSSAESYASSNYSTAQLDDQQDESRSASPIASSINSTHAAISSTSGVSCQSSLNISDQSSISSQEVSPHSNQSWSYYYPASSTSTSAYYSNYAYPNYYSYPPYNYYAQQHQQQQYHQSSTPSYQPVYTNLQKQHDRQQQQQQLDQFAQVNSSWDQSSDSIEKSYNQLMMKPARKLIDELEDQGM